MTVRIITDSTCYMPHEMREEYQIQVISLSVNFEEESFREEDIENDFFYGKMAQTSKVPTSSQPPVQELYNAFVEPVKTGRPALGIFMSSGLSGTFNSALMIRDQIREEYPDAAIEVLDSHSTGMELGFAVIAAAKSALAGDPIQVVIDHARRIMEKSRFIFAPEVLDYLRKGGRIGGASALLGSLLQIKPILTVIEGKAAVLEKVRTKGKAIETMIRILIDDVRAKGLGDVVVHHINNEVEALHIANILKDLLQVVVPIYPIGPVVGLHVGPGTVGMAYYTLK